MKNNPTEISTEKDLEKICEIAENVFGTAEDPDQVDANLENSLKLRSVDSHSILVEKEGDTLVGWAVAMPSSLENMRAFLNEDISERSLFDLSVETVKHEALYLMAVIVLPEFRRRGVGKRVITKQLDYFLEKYPSISQVYAWPWSEGGEALIQSLSGEFDILVREVK